MSTDPVPDVGQPTSECRDALTQKLSGSNKKYRRILAILSSPSSERCRWYQELSSCVTLLGPKMEELMNAIWDFDWNADDATLTAFVELVRHINSAHGTLYLNATFTMVIRKFIPLPPSDMLSEEERVEMAEGICHHLHTILKHVLWVIPNCSSVLWNIILAVFPHKSHGVPEQECFIGNLLLLMEYCPELKENILTLVVDRILQMDVDIKIQDIPDEKTAFGDVSDSDREAGFFVMDIDEDDDENMGENEDDVEIKKEFEEIARKLDVILDLLADHISSTDSSELDSYFAVMLRVFDKLILSTHMSKFTQFLLFHLCHLKEQYTSQFLDYLCGKFMTGPSSTRTTSACYIGSFVGRASFISAATCGDVMRVLMNWLHGYVDAYEGQPPDEVQHKLFYAVSQAAFYIFCFKHSLLANITTTTPFLTSLGFPRIIHSSLNPLKVVFPPIVKEFVNLASYYSIASFEDVLERNRNTVLLRSAATSHLERTSDTEFFPFDPYFLSQSSHHFKGAYIYWRPFSEQISQDDQDGNSHLIPSHTLFPAPNARNPLLSGHPSHRPLGIAASSLDEQTRFNIDDLQYGSWDRAQCMVEDDEYYSSGFDNPTPMSHNGYSPSEYE